MNTEQTLQLALESMAKVNENLTRQNEIITAQNVEMSQRIKELTAQIEWFQRQMFGRKSEKRLILDGQPSLFSDESIGCVTNNTNDGEEPSESLTDDNDNLNSKKRKSVKRPRQTWDNLPILETRTIEPQNVDLAKYRKIGEETTYLLGFEPGKLFRIAVIRPKYGLKDSTEVVERGEGVKIAPLPLFPIYKGMPSSSLLSEILLQKYEYHMPFYRQIKQFAHLGMTGLKEATLVGWFKRTMELLRPLYDALVQEIFQCDYIQSDETTVPVINNEKHQADKEYLWMARAVMKKLSAFFYSGGSRSGDVIKEKTDKYNFNGYLQCDGYAGYTSAYKPGLGVLIVCCLVHIRRYFEHALNENRKPASWFLGKIRELYHIESECDKVGMTFEQRKAERLLRSKPLLEEMKAWLENEGLKYSSRTLIGQAVSYAYTRWNNMMRILDDGRLLLDNNLAENEIRPITLGRKNFLFCGNHEAAKNMCVITSLLSTCRNHDVNPRLYLNSVIESMPYFMNAKHEDLVKLLPHKWKEYHPEAIMEKVRNIAM
jgi:transposase